MELFGEESYTADKLLAWQRSIKSTQYGAGGLTKAIVENGRVRFVNNITGAVYDTIDEAFEEIGKINATNFARIEFDEFGRSLSAGNLRGTAGLSELLLNLKQQTRGIVDAPERLFLEVGNIKRGDRLTDAQKAFLKDSLIVPEDQGYNFLRLGYRTAEGAIRNYSTEEMNKIFSRVGAGILSAEGLMKGLADEDVGIMGIFEKLGKRIKGAISLRGASISGDLLTGLLDEKTLGQSTLIVDTQEDLRKVLAGFLQDSSKTEQELFSGISKEARAFYGVADQPSSEISTAFQLVQDITNRLFTDAMPDADRQRITSALRSGSKAGLNKQQEAIYEEVMTSLERPFDGNLVINQKFVDRYRRSLSAEVRILKNKERTGSLTASEAEKLQELTSSVNMLRDNLEDVTARIYFKLGNSNVLLKGSVDSTKLSGVLDKFSIITSKAAIKKETAIMGTTETVNLVLHGEPRDLFYADPLAPGFHSGVFTDPSVLRGLEQNRLKAINEARQAILNNEISPKLMSSIIRESEKSIEDLPTNMQASAYRARQYAQELRTIIEQGHDFKSFPQLSNYLHKFMQSTMYREKDGMFQPVMDHVYRFSVRSELGINKKGLTSTYTPVYLTKDSDVATRLMNFRVEGHKMIFGGDAANVFHHSLGGFDFDDKGVPIMRVFKDGDGRRRISHFIMRQPTGPEEFILGQAELTDIETLQKLFGENEDLLRGLNIIKERGGSHAGAAAEVIEALSDPSMQSIAMRKSRSGKVLGSLDAINDAIIAAMEEVGSVVPELDRGILKLLKNESYGSTLALTDLTDYSQAASIGLEKHYLRGKIFQIFTNTPQGVPEVDEDLARSLQGILGQSDYETLARHQKGIFYALGEQMPGLRRSVQNDITAAISNYYNKVVLDNKVGSLGQYINRLTFSASMTNQLEDALAALPENVRASINQNYAIGFIKPEAAVDYSVNLSGKKVVIGAQTAQAAADELTKMAARGASVEAMTSAAVRLFGETGLYEDPLGYIGTMGISDTGKLFGKVRAESMRYGLSEDLLLGIDETILRQRLKNSTDINNFVQNFTNEMIAASQGSEDIETFARKVQKDVLSGDADAPEKLERLIGHIGLKAEHAYASVSKLNEMGLQSKEALDAVFAVSGRIRNMSYASEVSIDPKATRSAQSIIDFYKERMKIIDDQLTSKKTGMSEEIIAKRRFQIQELGARIEEMIFESAKVNNIAAADIVDNIQNLASYDRTGKGIDRLYSSLDDENSLRKVFEAAQNERFLRFNKRNQSLMNQAEEFLKIQGEVSAMAADEKKEVLDLMKRTLSTFNRDQSDQAIASRAFLLSEQKSVEEMLTKDQIQESRRVRLAANAVTQSQTETAKRLREVTQLDQQEILDSISNKLTDEEKRFIYGLDHEAAYQAKEPTRYRRLLDMIADSEASSAFKNPIVKKSAYALAALGIGAFIYSAHKDRTEEDASGPPLLPGGSAYEQMPQRQSQIPEGSMFSRSLFSRMAEGMNYNVNISGSEEQVAKFRSMANSVSQGPVNATMYNGLPQLGRDPYPEIASRF